VRGHVRRTKNREAGEIEAVRNDATGESRDGTLAEESSPVHEGGGDPVPSHCGREVSAAEILALYGECSRKLASAKSLQEVAEFSLQAVCDLTGWPLAQAHFCPGGEVPALAYGVSLHSLEDVPAVDAESSVAPRSAGLAARITVPVLAEGMPVATLEFAAAEGEVSAVVVDFLAFLSRELGQVAGRERTRRAVRLAAAQARKLLARMHTSGHGPAGSDTKLELIAAGAESALWYWDLISDRVTYSPRWAAWLGLPEAAFGDHVDDWLRQVHREDRERVQMELVDHLQSGENRFSSEHRMLTAADEVRYVRATGLTERDADGKALRMAGSVIDCTHQRECERRSERSAFYDERTGLPTRALLHDRLDLALHRKSRSPDRRFAVLIVRHFRVDSASDPTSAASDPTSAASDPAAAGSDPDQDDAFSADELLLTLARRLSACVRPGDTVAHLGEHEFGVILDDVVDVAAVRIVARRIRKEFSVPVVIDGCELRMGSLLGIALARTGHTRPESVLHDAEVALRTATRSDAGFEVFDGVAHSVLEMHEELESELRGALHRGEFYLEYQPTVSLTDGSVVGFEALLRWKHPTRGLVPPNQFLPLIEQTALIHQIGEWVIGQAVHQLRAWDEGVSPSYPLQMGINVSSRQLYHPDFQRTVREALTAADLDGSRVRLDVQERTLTAEPELAETLLFNLRESGVRAVIDDFGTGFSSLGLLHRYPIDALKIDRSFVSGGQGKHQGWAVAGTIVKLARGLQMNVIVEGIETREQLARFRRLGCQEGQGYLFSGPVSAAAAERLIREGYPFDLAVKTE